MVLKEKITLLFPQDTRRARSSLRERVHPAVPPRQDRDHPQLLRRERGLLQGHARPLCGQRGQNAGPEGRCGQPQELCRQGNLDYNGEY